MLSLCPSDFYQWHDASSIDVFCNTDHSEHVSWPTSAARTCTKRRLHCSAGSWPIYDVLAGRESGTLDLALQLLPPRMQAADSTAPEKQPSSASMQDPGILAAPAAAEPPAQHRSMKTAGSLSKQALSNLKERQGSQARSVPEAAQKLRTQSGAARHAAALPAPQARNLGEAGSALLLQKSAEEAELQTATGAAEQEPAASVQLRIESLTGLPVDTAAQWYISYLWPGEAGSCCQFSGTGYCCLGH